MQSFVAISRLSHRTAQWRRISGESKARRRTFAPQDHSRKSLKAGNLSDMRRSGDLFTDRRPRRHPAQVKTYRGSMSKEMSFPPCICSRLTVHLFPSWTDEKLQFFFFNLITDA
ncbi:hypothetical protein CHARACLAT_029280 [Characodon lateralis]|uniref:Uncharacterized protein n=1 Tax=Characodon lateralis TaxID=208331 RepID=A0ABU7EGP4_9TELE|nr:hypothetical protein [Characodon lateralis]